ncbi:nitrate- and nitrite sensing domain-containing protein [Streptomyces sp. PKU-EA00015]|uniref:sensor histidine kinase n=1 Tax=Streptomyces sp. PKU-EA00015 TaxID=2748326 RepID=UPI0015A4116E|nr:nitrate- and nitrite sensing domain-containing protein [Streptomyces sp. PKU-EA00015]NWF28969.1 nitrate- and nitrite sensing domain-containing protein [Streptomyces sp. PKU-EA00015]
MQGRFKRDGLGSPQARQGRGEAAAEQESRGGTDRGSSPQHAHNQGPAAPGDGGEHGARPGTSAPSPDGAKGPSTGKGPTDTGSRIALRNWRISTRLVSLLTLPVVAATTLGGLRIQESMDDMKQLDHMQLLTEMTRAATDLAQALQSERDLSAGPLANGSPVTDFKVSGPRNQTDLVKKAFLDATRNIPNTDDDEALESIRANANQIAVQVNGLNKIRSTAYEGDVPNSQTVEAYSRLIESLLSLSQDMAQATSNPEMIKRTRALAAFSSAKEYASIQRAIIAAALPGGDDAKAPGLSENDRLYGKAAVENGETELKAFKAIYESTGGDAEELTATLDNGNPTIAASELYAKRVLDTEGQISRLPERSHLDWTDDYSVRVNAMKQIEATLLGQMETKARELREESQRDAIINGALILVVLGVSLVGAFVVARSMIRSLRRLQDTATRVAQDRLPELVKQLSEADPQDVDTSVESVGVHSRDEIGQVAAAFDDVHREAVRLAAEQALLRGNVNAMFTNLSRRSQGLIQRQLSLISELESREADPDQLSSLFKLDHLATRMRRNGENLLVLAGEEPGRRWTRPVPLVDVLRAAASEVEQYERIELAAVPATEVAGRVVNDLVHLLAELLENATSFSSPQTKVRVTGHALPDGRVLVEIHDTGIGLSPEDLAAINERLASPPTVDVSVSRRMGLFVVGRLSLRHGIRIQLRPSDSGGTTALVMLPVDVAHGGKKVPGKPGAGGPGAAAQGPAGDAPGLAGRPGAPAGGSRPGLGGGPGAGGAPSGGRLGAGAPRGQVGAPSAPRAALPGRDGAPRPAQGGQHGSPHDPQRQGGAFGAARGGQGTPAPARNEAPQGGFRQGAPGAGDRGRQLPPTGGPRAELPGGSPARREEQRPQRPQTTSWGSSGQAPTPQQRPVADTPRGHEDHDASRGLGATAEFARPDFNAPAGPGSTGQFVRPDVYGGQNGAQPQDPAQTAQFARPDFQAPQQPAPRRRDEGFPPARPAASLPAPHQPEALPPASGPGDGRTPLYDTLETNWFHGAQGGQHAEQPQPPERSAPRMPLRSPAPNPGNPGNAPSANTAAWRTSPNDELVRQAERVRKPAAGGITTSGLPRRVPRANLVPGTAQEQNHNSGPQVSRAPDDVRGRLTNLRRGIQQGRQQNNSTTGSFNLGPTHQQER